MHSKKLYTAKLSLTIFKLIGIWPNENSKGLFTLYNFYTILVACSLSAFVISNACYTFNHNFRSEEFTESCFYSFAIFIDAVKMTVIYRKNKKIRELVNSINTKQFLPRDSNEILIQNKFYKIER